jgi:hypothetical protein
MGFWSKIFGKGGSYFLEDETAKGLGDTEYMKQPKSIRRTFPGAAGEEEFEQVRQVSAESASVYDTRVDGARPPAAAPAYQSNAASSFGTSSWGTPSFSNSSFNSTPAPAPEPTAAAEKAETPAPAPAPTFQQPRRDVGSVDTSMDMFRNMAKKIK